jgi:gamma-glutamylcyclotransferase (GGCT)/AIG2-like uncharacterized protein YtfP
MNHSRRLPLFVYGTLRRGGCNHDCLEGHYERCIVARLIGFARGAAGHGFPTIRRAPGGCVEGELFFLPSSAYDAVLRRCDRLEGLSLGETRGAFYARIRVRVETAEGPTTAWAYAEANTPEAL